MATFDELDAVFDEVLALPVTTMADVVDGLGHLETFSRILEAKWLELLRDISRPADAHNTSRAVTRRRRRVKAKRRGRRRR